MIVPLDSTGGVLVPCYMGVISPGADGRQGNRLVPAVDPGTKGTMSPGVATNNSNTSIHLLNEFVTYVNSGVTVPAPASPSTS